MNTGNNRFVDLNFNQSGNTISLTLPNDSLLIPDGFYMLFAMVDDIPSIAKIISLVGSFTTDIHELQSSTNITIYPNPSYNTLTINNKNFGDGIFSVDIVDITGKVLKEWKMLNKIETIPINDLPVGSYLIRFKSEKYNEIKRIIVVR